MSALQIQLVITLRALADRIEGGDVPTWLMQRIADVVALENGLLAKLDARKEFCLCKECGAALGDFFAFEAHVRAVHRRELSGKPLLSLVVK